MSPWQIFSIGIVLFVGFFPTLTNVNFPTWAIIFLFFIALILFIIPILRDIKRTDRSIQSNLDSEKNELLRLKKSRRNLTVILIVITGIFVAAAIGLSYVNLKVQKLHNQIERMKTSQNKYGYGVY